MLIGVISDTHGYFHPHIPEAFRDVELILHGGDVGPVAVLNQLREIAPVRGVYGNVDGPPVRGLLPETDRLEVEGVRFLLHHIGGQPNKWSRGVGAMLRAEQPDVFICGHSHILRIERVPELNSMLYLNPGAAGWQGFHREKTCVRLLVEAGAAKQAEVVHLDG
ncbi:MAG: metallophosphoesterase family protein [Rubricoccaceae bacterium]|nr:metallophosphoesterase family protein [Rubricoccaceae bacterium]